MAGNAIATNSSLSTFIVDTVDAPDGLRDDRRADDQRGHAAAQRTTTIKITYADATSGVNTSTFGTSNITVNNGATVTGSRPAATR